MQKKKVVVSFSFKNKGLSQIVTTLLLVLLSLVAVGVVWVVVRNLINNSASQINVNQLNLDLSIKAAYIDGSNVKVDVRRGPGGGNITGIMFIFSNGTSSTTVVENVSLTPLEEQTFSFTSAQVGGISSVKSVSVAPIYMSSGKIVTGSVTDTSTISSTPPLGGGSAGTTTTTNNGAGPANSGTCGDFLIEDPNINHLYEVCDRTNLNNQNCITQGYPGGGNLSCNATCNGFDYSKCVGATPSTCDGVWNQSDITAGNQCDGGGSPGNVSHCTTTCTCENGFSSTGTGGCSLNPPVNTGIIYSVWNKIYMDSVDLPTSRSTIISYIGKYVNFSNSAETKCFQINYADVADTGRGYIRLDNSIAVPNISAGQNYSIWTATNCGQTQ